MLLGASLALVPAPPVADTVSDTVFVASNRRRVARGFTRDVTDSIWYGIYVTRLVTNGGGSRTLAAMRVQRLDSASMDEPAWSARLAGAIRDTTARHAALVYVHGYSSSPGIAVAQAVQVKARGAHGGPLIVFLWPTHSRYVAPPTPARAYRDDAAAAARSGPALARVLGIVDSLAPGSVLVTHSMGTRVALAAAIGDTAMRQRLEARPLRAFGIFSPDIGAAHFRADFAPLLPLIARRVALYGASNDYLLGMAALVNRERRASGITARGAALSGIELVDVTRGARAEPALLTLLGPRHAVRWASAALADFFGIVVAGAPGDCRVAAASAVAQGEGRWQLRAHATLPEWLDATCAPSALQGR
ncbi:MAG: alpha/beta hydrolase [Gemmatimonadota bacterium]